MDQITKDDLKELMKKQNGLCVSLFMPAHRALPETRQDPIRFKNLLAQAERNLIDAGLSSSESGELLRPAQQLLNDAEFWRHQADGLAIFLAPGKFLNFRLPITFDEMVATGTRFHLKPLLQMFSNEGRFFILAISQNQVKLLRASRFQADQLKVENLPEGLADILGQYDFEKQLQFHTSAPAASNNRTSIIHGHGSGEGMQKERIIQYFRRVDTAVSDSLKEDNAPLVFAGVEQLFPLYKEVSTYPNLLDQYIPGNPDLLTADQLQQSAWEIVRPVFAEPQQMAVAKYHSLAGTGLTENRLEEIVQSAHHGRIQTLFVAAGQQYWGHFDSENNQLHRHNKANSNSEDLLDLAALKTIETGGDVFIVQQAKLPGGQMAAAIYRY